MSGANAFITTAAKFNLDEEVGNQLPIKPIVPIMYVFLLGLAAI